jgi:SAM-dependent methyltransferase
MEPFSQPLDTPPREKDPSIERLERTSSRARARMRFALHRESSVGRQTDWFVATRLNLWRDIFPPEPEAQLMGEPVAHLASHGFAPGEPLSSWHSHLPEDIRPSKVVGPGMNRKELDANPVLTERLVHDLNETPVPFADATFDAVVRTVSVEYLTHPFEVFREIARITKPRERFVTTFSNRWFPPKVIPLREGMHEFEGPGPVSEYFLESGLFGKLQTWPLRGLPSPEDDKYPDRLATSDPVYAVWTERR